MNMRYGEAGTMARNKAQFQKGLSEARFEALYGTEEKCRAVVISSRWPNGFECPACGGRAYCEVTTRGLFQCSACRHQASPIAGTIFASTHLAAAAVVPRDVSPDPKQAGHLQHRVGPPPRRDADHRLEDQHKLAQVMMERDAAKQLSGGRIGRRLPRRRTHRRQARPRRPRQDAVCRRRRNHARGQAGAVEAAPGRQLLQSLDCEFCQTQP